MQLIKKPPKTVSNIRAELGEAVSTPHGDLTINSLPADKMPEAATLKELKKELPKKGTKKHLADQEMPKYKHASWTDRKKREGTQ